MGTGLRVVRSGRETTLYSRRQNVFNQKFPHIAAAWKDLPDDTVIDGEVVALGADGKPDFNLLQNFRSAESRRYVPQSLQIGKFPSVSSHDEVLAPRPAGD